MSSSDWNEMDTIKSGEPVAGAGAVVDAKERHKLAERERRKSMGELFLSLHALLPHAATVRREQSTVLDEIVKYIPIAVARLRSLKKQKETPVSAASPAVRVSSRDSGECSIRVMSDPFSSVSIRVRGDRVKVSLTDTKCSQARLLSSVLDELEAHGLELIRSTHCRDGSKLLHHSESKICDGLDRSPALLKERLQELACKLHDVKKSSSLKRSFDQKD